MTTGIPSGLGETLGFAQESAVGTAVTVARWPQHLKAPITWKKKTAQSQALHGGLYELAARRVLVTQTIGGTIEYDAVADREFGLLLKHMLGSTPILAQQGSSAAWLQTHTPGDTTGLGLTLQKGIPQTNGTIQSFTWNGCKIIDWELSVQVDGLLKLTLTVDGWNEVTTVTYAAPSRVAGNVFHFGEGAILLGGTPSTSGGVCSISSGAAPTGLVRAFSIKGSNPMNVSRYTLGSPTKAEQLANALRKITGQVEIEFANLTDFYNTFKSDASTALQVNFTGPVIATPYTSELNVLVPNLKWEGETPVAEGPDVIAVKVPFSGLDDGTNPPIQLQYQSLDTAA